MQSVQKESDPQPEYRLISHCCQIGLYAPEDTLSGSTDRQGAQYELICDFKNKSCRAHILFFGKKMAGMCIEAEPGSAIQM